MDPVSTCAAAAYMIVLGGGVSWPDTLSPKLPCWDNEVLCKLSALHMDLAFKLDGTPHTAECVPVKLQ